MQFDHIIYHAGCMDGFTSAYLLREQNMSATIHEGYYGDAIPTGIDGKNVVMADFSYLRDDVVEIASKADYVVVLDHHQTALEHLTNMPSNVEMVLDMDRSGARITWDYLYPDDPAPALVNYVMDRDLWKWELRFSHEIGAYISSVPMDWNSWDNLDDDLDLRFEKCLVGGQSIVRRDEVLIAQILKTARWVTIAGYQVKAAACPYGLGSEIAGRLAGETTFGAYYIDYPDRREFGLRSPDSGLDVAAIAETYGGGGHKHASGFRIPRDTVTAAALLA